SGQAAGAVGRHAEDGRRRGNLHPHVVRAGPPEHGLSQERARPSGRPAHSAGEYVERPSLGDGRLTESPVRGTDPLEVFKGDAAMRVIDTDGHVVETEHTWDFMEPSDAKYRPYIATEKNATGSPREQWVID